MTFEKETFLVKIGSGVCQVLGEEEERGIRFLKLRVIFPTIYTEFVPINRADELLRSLESRETADKAIKILRGSRPNKNGATRGSQPSIKRQGENIARILAKNDLIALATLACDLYKGNKSVHFADQRKKIIEQVSYELSLILEKRYGDMKAEVIGFLTE